MNASDATDWVRSAAMPVLPPRERGHSRTRESTLRSNIPWRMSLSMGRRLQILERKIEDLAARQELQPPQPQGPVPTRLFNPDTSSPTRLGVSQWSTSAGTPSSAGLLGSTPSHSSSIEINNAGRETGDIVDRGVVAQDLAQVLLDRFRINAAQQFPFVVIPADASLEAVRGNTPFLFLAVTATMMFDNPLLQHRLGEEVRQQAFQRMLSRAEKNLDLLQGLLVYIAWYCHFYRPDTHEELMLSQLCVTLAHELSINKSKTQQVDQLDQCRPVSNAEPSPSLAKAQMRAYLGTYCVSCLYVASIFRRKA
jgi:hypothetical protein